MLLAQGLPGSLGLNPEGYLRMQTTRLLEAAKGSRSQLVETSSGLLMTERTAAGREGTLSQKVANQLAAIPAGREPGVARHQA